jgi:hypothetical protein
LYLGGWAESERVNGGSQANPPRSLAPPLGFCRIGQRGFPSVSFSAFAHELYNLSRANSQINCVDIKGGLGSWLNSHDKHSAISTLDSDFAIFGSLIEQ